MTAAVKLVNLTEADTFLRLLGDRHTFQTFDDAGKHRRDLSRILHGTLAEHAHALADSNARSAGVFVMVNEGDSIGRKAENVKRIRAYFVDLDGAPLEPVHAAPLPAHCIIETSPRRWHAYWFVENAPLDNFRPVQRMLAERFDADKKVCDLPRVMRLPGFLHRKATPFQTRIIELRNAPRYTHAQFVKAFDVRASDDTMPQSAMQRRAAVVTPLRKRTLSANIAEGERNATMFELACGLVRQGYDSQAVNDRVQRINAERCQPPLCASEVDTIATRAVAYGSDGFTMLPHALLDSPEWKALPPPAHDVIVTAFRRYNGRNNGNIALTWADFDGQPGFARKHTFYRHRARAVTSGILRQSARGSNTRDGKKPDLFSIAPQWLHGSPVSKLKPCASVENVHPYIDKQSLAESADSRGSGQTKANAR